MAGPIDGNSTLQNIIDRKCGDKFTLYDLITDTIWRHSKAKQIAFYIESIYSFLVTLKDSYPFLEYIYISFNNEKWNLSSLESFANSLKSHMPKEYKLSDDMRYIAPAVSVSELKCKYTQNQMGKGTEKAAYDFMYYKGKGNVSKEMSDIIWKYCTNSMIEEKEDDSQTSS